MKFFRNIEYYKNLSYQDEKRLQFLLTANGLSYGRTLDANRELTAITNNPVDNKNSRRVEFKIITTSENLIEKVLKELGK